MRVLAVGSMYPPHHLGGYELVWEGAMRRLTAAGHEVDVLASDLRLPGRRAPDPPHVHRELPWYWRDHGFPRRGPRARLAVERGAAGALERRLRAARVDVVTLWSLGGLPMSLPERVAAAGIPSVAFVHDDWPLYGPLVDAWTALTDRPVLRGVAALLSGARPGLSPEAVSRWVFVSESTRSRVEPRIGPLPAAEVLPSGVDLAAFEPQPAEPWRWRLLVAGRLDPRKGVDTAIEALALLPAASRLTVAGEGDSAELARLRRRADDRGLGDRVRFVGQLDRTGLAAAYRDADAVLFPVRWEEPWGLVPLEAMASGRPVVASGRGGSAEYLREGQNALLAPADDPRALADAVRRLAEDPALRERLRAGGLTTARERSAQRFEAEVLRIVGELSAGARGGPRAGR